MVGFVVDSLCYGGCLACPLIVAINIGMCCMMAVAASPDHPEKWLLLMATIHAKTGGEKRHWG